MTGIYRDAVADMARAGATPARIMESLGCCKQTVYTNWPADLPTPHMLTQAAKVSDNLEPIMTLRQKGFSQKRIAEKLGLHVSYVHRVISRYNTGEDDGEGRGVIPNPPPRADEDPSPPLL